MKKSLIWIATLVLISGVSTGKRLGLKFDDHGNMIGPDDYLVHQALKDDDDGYKNDAMWRLQEAAEYGNKHAQYYAGLLYLQKDDYINGYAWLKLSGDDFLNNPNLLPAVKLTLKERKQMQSAKQALNDLEDKINFDTTLAKRMNWYKRLKFGGSKIGGYIPVFWKTQLNDGVIVQSHDLRQDMKQYLFNYRYQQGNVRLKELELESNSLGLD